MLCLLGAIGCASTPNAHRLAIPAPNRWTVTASAADDGFAPKLATDGHTNTAWRTSTDEPSWVQASWSRPAMVCGFAVQWGHPFATDYALETSLDGKQWAIAFEIKDGDGGEDSAVFEPILARFVRLKIEKTSQGRRVALTEFSIYDLGIRPQIHVDGILDLEAEVLLDHSLETVWRSPRSSAVLELDLRNEKQVGSLRVDWGRGGFASNVVVEASRDSTNWVSFGRIQAQAGDFDVLMLENATPVRWLRMSFSGASAPPGFEVTRLILRGAEGTTKLWALLEIAAQHAPPGLYPDILRRRQNYWAVAAGPKPGCAESLLGEWSTFAPHAASATLVPLLEINGELFSAQQAHTREYRLGADAAPMPEMTWKLSSGISLRIRAMAHPKNIPAMSWVKYDLQNESQMPLSGRLILAVRPVRLTSGPSRSGWAPIHRIRAANAGPLHEVRVNDVPLFAVPRQDIRFGAAAFDEGDVIEFFRRGEIPKMSTVSDEEGLASGAWWMDFELEPGARTDLVVAANAQVTEPTPQRRKRFFWNGPDANIVDDWSTGFECAWGNATWMWRDETSRLLPRIARPTAMDCLRAQVGWLLGRHGTDGENMETTTWRIAALLRAGQASIARQWLNRVAAGIHTNGWVPERIAPLGSQDPPPVTSSRYAQHAQFVFMAMETYRFTQDAAYLQELYPQILAAMRHLQNLRTEAEKSFWKISAPENELAEGLLPATSTREGSRPQFRLADQMWGLLGWKEMRAAASILGRSDDVVWSDSNYRSLKTAVRRAWRTRMELMDEFWIPATLEDGRYSAATIALLFWPCAESDLAEPHELQSSLDKFYEDFLARTQPGGEGITSADEAALLVPLATMGRGDYAREVLDALLGQRYPAGWNFWARSRATELRQTGQVSDMPDLKTAAAYLIGVRGLAARENDKKLELFSGPPPEWLQYGEGFRVYGMPTAFGSLDLAGFWAKNLFTVEIAGAARPPSGYRIWWPLQGLPERVTANGKRIETFDSMGCNLPHDFKGKLEAILPFDAPWPREP